MVVGGFRRSSHHEVTLPLRCVSLGDLCDYLFTHVTSGTILMSPTLFHRVRCCHLLPVGYLVGGGLFNPSISSCETKPTKYTASKTGPGT